MPRQVLPTTPEPVLSILDANFSPKPPLKQDTSIAPSIIQSGPSRKPVFNPEGATEGPAIEVKEESSTGE